MLAGVGRRAEATRGGNDRPSGLRRGCRGGLRPAVGCRVRPLAGVSRQAPQRTCRPRAPAASGGDVEAIIAREVQSARLAVSVEFLAAQPGLEQYSERARRYLTETYGSTRAAQGSVDPLRN